MATDYDKELDSIREDLDDLHDNKVDVVKGKQLSTNDFTNEHLRKVNRIETKEYQQEIVAGVAKDIQQANDNHVRLADEFHRHLYGQDGVDAKFKKEIQDNLNYMSGLVKSANDRMNEIWQNWDEIVKEDQNHELRLQQVEGKTLTHDALIDSNTSEILNIQGEQVIQNNQIKEMQDKSVELETRVVDVEVSDADQNHRLDIAENRIGTFTDRMTALEDGYAQRDARMDGLDAQVSRYTERMLALELNEKAQNDRLKAEEEKNKRQDIDIACLYAEAKDRTITLDTEGTAVELQNSREGFVTINSIEGNTMVNCNKDVDKEVTLLTSTVDKSADNNVTLTEGVVDDGLVDVYLEGNTLVNVSKTKDDYITPSIEDKVDKGSVISIPEEGYINIDSIEGNTLVNYCTDGAKELTLNGDIDVEGVDNVYNVIIKPNTLYTVALDTNKTGTIRINLGGAEVTTTNNVAMITTPETLTDNTLKLYGTNIKCSKVRLLEGDKTNWIPSYFEGMKSSFEDKVQDDGSYKMEVLMNNKNLIDMFSYIINFGNEQEIIEDKSDNSITVKCRNMHPWSKLTYRLYLQEGESFYVSYKGTRINAPTTQSYFDFKRVLNADVYITGTYSPNGMVVTASMGSGYYDFNFYFSGDSMIENDTVTFKDIMISKVEGDFVPHKSNKIQFSSIEPLRGVGDVHDRLVFKDGKLMIERRSATFNMKDIVNMFPNTNLGYDANEDKFGYYNLNIPVKTNTNFDYALCNIAYMKDEYASRKNQFALNNNYVRIHNDFNVGSISEFEEYVKNNNIIIIYELIEPTYEEIPYDLQKIILESYNNGTLFIDTNIPPTKVSFNCFEEELTYLYPATSYTVQFVSDKAITADIALGGTSLLAQNIVKGLNRITMTTPSELADNKLIISGAGAKISEVVVTYTGRKFGYFEGMKSVGECEELGITCRNSVIDNTQNKMADIPMDTGTEVSDNRVLVTGFNIITADTNPNSVELFDKDLNKVSPSTDWTSVSKRFYRKDKTYIGAVNDGTAYYVRYRCLRTASSTSLTPDDIDNFIFADKNNPTTKAYQSNTQQLTHEPLRAVGDVKDRYVLIDGKWYVERNTYEYKITKDPVVFAQANTLENYEIFGIDTSNSPCHPTNKKPLCDKFLTQPANWNNLHHEEIECVQTYDNDRIFIKILSSRLPKVSDYATNNFKEWLINNEFSVIYQSQTPVYEPIDYNPFEVYSSVTHISTNSTIPCNVTVKNHGYNCILKPSTTYTVVSNQGVQNMTTPATLGDSLRFSGNGLLKDVMILEGTLSDNQIPGFFAGMESCYEQKKITDEHDEHFGYYEVLMRVNAESGKESVIKFYIKDPLRGIGEVKDKVFIQDDKVIVQRNCGQREYVEGDFEAYVTDRSTTVYPLDEPFIEEAVYSGIRLSQNIWEKSTLFFDTNIPSTANISYSVSTPILDQVAEVSSITDDQDALIIDMATQLAVLNMTM